MAQLEQIIARSPVHTIYSGLLWIRQMSYKRGLSSATDLNGAGRCFDTPVHYTDGRLAVTDNALRADFGLTGQVLAVLPDKFAFWHEQS
jgi:hypothetical protein